MTSRDFTSNVLDKILVTKAFSWFHDSRRLLPCDVRLPSRCVLFSLIAARSFHRCPQEREGEAEAIPIPAKDLLDPESMPDLDDEDNFSSHGEGAMHAVFCSVAYSRWDQVSHERVTEGVDRRSGKLSMSFTS